MPVPTPPPDNSGGYMVIQYVNSTTGDKHRMRVHVRPFDASAVYTAGGAAGEPTVPDTFTNFAAQIKWAFGAHWTFTLLSIFRNVGGVFTEIFGWTSPAAVVGTSAVLNYVNPGDRATQVTFIMNDGFGGRLRMVFLGPEPMDPGSAPSLIAGNPAGSVDQKMVDYLSTASKTNIVSHNGHVVQSPAHATFVINRRLRRHYGFA